MGSEIIVCGQRFDIGHPVVTFEDPHGYDARIEHRTDDPTQIYPTAPAAGMEQCAKRYRERRLLGAERRLADLKQVVRQVVVHLDGCKDARMCFDVLHNEHGLSVHFMVDNDGTIYQTLDLLHCAFHASGVNETSVGIEIQNRGDAARFPNYYHPPRPTVTCQVHGVQFLAYEFTEAQYAAMTKLAGALARILEIPLVVPRGADQAQIWTTIDQPRRFNGFIGHYHVTDQKWDPGPWDFARMLRSVGSRVTFPLTPMRPASAPQRPPPAEEYFENAEHGSGYFPVGPYGASRLWHGGVHLSAQPGSPIYAPIRGQLVAARMTGPCGVGSCNFVLLRHALEGAERALRFFSLYFHVAEERANGETTPDWLQQAPEAAVPLAEGRTALLRRPIEAGEMIAHVAEAGPPGDRHPEVHFAIFAEENITDAVDPGAFHAIDGGDDSHFCRSAEVIDLIDRPEDGRSRDGLLSRRELLAFFRESDARSGFRWLVVRHLAEWYPGDWQTELEGARDFAALSAEARRQILEQQIEPTLWWTQAVAEHAGLPRNGAIFSYNPIAFLVWYGNVLGKLAGQRARGIQAARPDFVPAASTAAFKLDAESSAQMTDDEDRQARAGGQKLSLEEMIDGYPD